MGRSTKTQYPRTETLKVRSSAEHRHLISDIRKAIHPLNASDADIISWALEEYAFRNFKNKINFIPKTQPKIKTSPRGKTIEIGKHY